MPRTIRKRRRGSRDFAKGSKDADGLTAATSASNIASPPAARDGIMHSPKSWSLCDPDVILAHTTLVTTALQRESHEIPIVFINLSDPIGSGFVASLAHPAGNLTGLLLYEEGITGKWLAMLKE